MAEINVSTKAHCKLLLHAVKYPHAAVNGILLAEDNRNKESKVLKIVDAIPLFHVSLGLSPMLEMALLQVEAFCKGKNLVIAGYYQANENYNDNEMNHVARTIGRKVQENFHEACLFMIDNRRVKADSVSQPYTIYSLKESGWKESDRKNTSEDDISKEECVYALIKSGSQRQLFDFDNHFDDVKNDWRNQKLNELIDRCT